MTGLRNRPDRLRLAGRIEVHRVQALLPSAAWVGVDEEDRPRRDARDEILQVRRRPLVRENRGRARRQRVVGEQEPLARTRRSQLLADGAVAGPVGDDRLEVVCLGRRFQEELPSDREPEAADPLGIDVGPGLQERDRGQQVARPSPTPNAL